MVDGDCSYPGASSLAAGKCWLDWNLDRGGGRTYSQWKQLSATQDPPPAHRTRKNKEAALVCCIIAISNYTV